MYLLRALLAATKRGGSGRQFTRSMQGIRRIQDIPQALRETLEKGKPEYIQLIRQTRWGEGPIYMCACGPSAHVSLVGTYAFESLLGRPVVRHTPEVFRNYSSLLLQPRSVLLVISASGDAPEVLDLARLANSRGAVLLAMTTNASSLLAESAQGVFLIRAEPADDAPATTTCEHLALTYLAWLAAQTLRRPSPQGTSLEEEFEKLPAHAEWCLIHLAEAIRSLASELTSRQSLWVVGGGFYHAAALQAAERMRALAGVRAAGMEIGEFTRGIRAPGQDAALFLSGSRSKLKKEVHHSASQAVTSGMRLLAITDPDDRELADRCDLAVLTPSFSEVVRCTLVLMLVEWLALEAARQVQQERRPSPEEPHSRRGRSPGRSA